MSNDAHRYIAALTATIEQANNTLRERMDELSLARRVGDAISQHTSVWSLSSELVEAIATTITCKYALIYAGPSASEFELQAVSRVFASSDRFPIALRDGRVIQYLKQSGDPIRISNIHEDERWRDGWPLPSNLASWLLVPLLTRNHLRGVLCLADDVPAAFDEQTLRPLMIVVPQISSAFSNIALYDRLRESETKYRKLVARMQDVVYICNGAWEILDANPAAEVLFGCPIAGKHLTELFASPNAASEFVQAVQASRGVKDFETHLLTAANQSVVALMSCTSDGEGYSGIIKDMTERTRLLDQITRAQKMESIGRLASGAADDFNNYIGTILPAAELIRTNAGNQSMVAGYAETIVEASQRAAQLTKQLVSLSRTDPVSLRRINLNEAVRATAKLIQEVLHRDIQCEFDLAPESLHIKADEAQMQQVLLNLAINARDAMPQGGLLKFKTRHEGAKAIVQVKDTGCGIDNETLPKIFDPFFTTKEKSKGTGLGLSVVYGIVKQTGGTIDVKSEVGIGTEFTLTFPSTDESRHRKARRTMPRPGGSEKILIADDEPEILKLLEATLMELGYSVVCARNGIEAVEQAQSDVKLIILDMVMPEMDGMAALRSIREKIPHVKILVISGYTSPERTPLLEAMDIQRFVQKPFELVKLAGAVRDVLDGVAV
jgi:nitrogen-specific signal transduction histidine kinase